MVDDFLKIHNLEALNTRVVRLQDKHYQVLVASVNVSQQAYYYLDNRIDVVYGDFSPFLRRVVQNLQKCIQHAANHNQRTMLKNYVDHFTKGGKISPVERDPDRSCIEGAPQAESGG